jgi:flagella basal body P-ring formation protein FlgA
MSHTTNIRRSAAAVALGLIGTGAQAQAADGVQSLEAIRKTAQVFVRERIPGEPNTVEVTVGNLDARLRLAACSQPLQASLPAGATIAARTMVAVTCPGEKRWTVYVPVTIATNVSILTLRHAAARGARLSAEDVEVQVRKVQGTSASYLTTPAELAGRVLKRPMGPGSILTADAFADDALVKRGQQVTLLAAVGGIEVRATGKALSDAPAAGRVRVQNLASQQVVEGVVENGNVIRVTP